MVFETLPCVPVQLHDNTNGDVGNKMFPPLSEDEIKTISPLKNNRALGYAKVCLTVSRVLERCL